MTGWEGSVTIALLGCSFLFAYLYANTDELNKFLKVLFLAGALLFGMSSLAIQDNILEENYVIQNTTIINALHSNYEMSVLTFRISMVLVVIWLIYAGVMAIMGKRERFNYDE